MRIPKLHGLTNAYIEKFGLKVSPFTMGNPNAYYYVNGRLHRIRDAEENFSALNFPLAETERDRTVSALWEETIRPFVERIEQGGEESWAEVAAEYDQYSTREVLEGKGWSVGAIEACGLLDVQEAVVN